MRMRPVGIIVAMLGLALPAAAAEPQGPPISAMMQNVLRNSMQLNVVAGRIVNGMPWRFGAYSRDFPINKERITFKNAPGGGELSYEFTTPQEHFVAEIAAGGKFCFRREGKPTAAFTPVEFSQTANNPLAFSVGDGASRRQYHGKSLWHLWIAAPDACSQHMAPVLQAFCPQWTLKQSELAIEGQLMQIANVGNRPEQKQWAALVAQLGDERFGRRQAADRALRDAGSPVLAFLQQLNMQDLDAEQQFRLRRIMDSLTSHVVGDSPELTAAWLAEDPAVWLAMLGRPDVAQRRAGAAMLTRMLHAPVPVDPEAAPDSQTAGFEKLRARIDSLKPAESKPAG
jgi:hypothetical protein